MNETILCLVDTKTFLVKRYVGRLATHSAHASYLDAELIEDFRTIVPDEFKIESPAK